MTRRAKTVLIAVTVLAVLFVAGRVAFMKRDERLAAAFRFAVMDPQPALNQITEAAQGKGGLANSGVGVAIPERDYASLGPTRWAVSADGTLRGTAPERGLVVLLTPEMRDGKVWWNCSAEPAREFIPALCANLGQPNR